MGEMKIFSAQVRTRDKEQKCGAMPSISSPGSASVWFGCIFCSGEQQPGDAGARLMQAGGRCQRKRAGDAQVTEADPGDRYSLHV